MRESGSLSWAEPGSVDTTEGHSRSIHHRGTSAPDRPFTPGQEGAGVPTVRPGHRAAFTGHPRAD
jgi:hypothetical protein